MKIKDINLPYFRKKHIFLLELVKKGFNTCIKLSNKTKLTPSTIHQTITFLEKEGYIIKLEKTGKHNERIIKITKKGNLVLNLWKEYNKNFYLIRRDRLKMDKCLKKYNESLEDLK